MRVSARWLMLTLVVLLLGIGGCTFSPLLSDVTVAPNAISPNADGKDDVTLSHCTPSAIRPWSRSTSWIAGNRHYFREADGRFAR